MKYNDFCKSCQHRTDNFLRVCCKARWRKVLKVNPPNLINKSFLYFILKKKIPRNEAAGQSSGSDRIDRSCWARSKRDETLMQRALEVSIYESRKMCIVNERRHETLSWLKTLSRVYVVDTHLSKCCEGVFQVPVCSNAIRQLCVKSIPPGWPTWTHVEILTVTFALTV